MARWGMKQFSVEARLRSFVYAGRGVVTLLVSQHNAWIHAVATAAVVGVGLLVGLQRLEWLALVAAIVLVWMAEAMNTAFEFLCDVASPGFHPLVARAKDVAAASVLICALGALATAALVFAPHVSLEAVGRATDP
jgi:diacylglycerol kinase (ATP)